jgi:hypothetical protein
MRIYGSRSAAKIESRTRDFAGPGSPPDPRGRLKFHRREMARREPPRRGNTRGAGPDYRDVHVSGHWSMLSGWWSCVSYRKQQRLP